MLAYEKMLFSFFARLPLTMPDPHQPSPARTRIKRGTTLVESTSVEAAGAYYYYYYYHYYLPGGGPRRAQERTFHQSGYRIPCSGGSQIIPMLGLAVIDGDGELLQEFQPRLSPNESSHPRLWLPARRQRRSPPRSARSAAPLQNAGQSEKVQRMSRLPDLMLSQGQVAGPSVSSSP